jgi:hypothetical protein
MQHSHDAQKEANLWRKFSHVVEVTKEMLAGPVNAFLSIGVSIAAKT